MATGRTVLRHARIYADGYDLSGYAMKIGALETQFDTATDAALMDEVQNVMPGAARLTCGTLNGFFDNTASSGLHVVANGAGVKRTMLIPIGINAAPAQGDPCFAGEFEQLTYTGEPGDGFVTVSADFGATEATGATTYTRAWGALLHAKGAENTTNSSAGVDDYGAATTYGGFMAYQLFSSDGALTIKVQDSANNSSWLDLSGATSGSVNASVTPASGLVALGRTATVRRYLRWQIVLDTATTATFALAFVRATF